MRHWEHPVKPAQQTETLEGNGGIPKQVTPNLMVN